MQALGQDLDTAFGGEGGGDTIQPRRAGPPVHRALSGGAWPTCRPTAWSTRPAEPRVCGDSDSSSAATWWLRTTAVLPRGGVPPPSLPTKAQHRLCPIIVLPLHPASPRLPCYPLSPPHSLPQVEGVLPTAQCARSLLRPGLRAAPVSPAQCGSCPSNA